MSEPLENFSSEHIPHDDLQLLTTAEVARLLVVRPGVVREMALAGELEASWIGRGYRFRRSAVEAAIEHRRVTIAGRVSPRRGPARRSSVAKRPGRGNGVLHGRHAIEKAPRKGVLTNLLKDGHEPR